MPFPVERFGWWSPLHHRERSEATQGGATREDLALLDCFAALARTAAPL